MSTPQYPWYGYVNRITDNSTKHKSKKELAAVQAALEAADPETRAIVQIVLVTRSKELRAAASDFFISYGTAKHRIRDFRKSVARNLGLLEE